MRKRHINEFMKSSFNHGSRAAGTGINEDSYSEESSPEGKSSFYQRYPNGIPKTSVEEAAKANENGKVRVYKWEGDE